MMGVLGTRWELCDGSQVQLTDQVLISGSCTHSSCRRRRILALASASSTLRCCLLSVRRMLGESLGDWAQGGGGAAGHWPQSRSCVSSTIVCGEKHNINTIPNFSGKERIHSKHALKCVRCKDVNIILYLWTLHSLIICICNVLFRFIYGGA